MINRHPFANIISKTWSMKLREFFSWRLHIGALTSDELSIQWNIMKRYIFPPFTLIMKHPVKIEGDQTLSYILLVQMRKNQPWYLKVMKLLMHGPILLPVSKTLPTIPQCNKLPTMEISTISTHLFRKQFLNEGTPNTVTNTFMK